MLLNVSEDMQVDTAPPEVWKLLRDTRRLAGLLPGVESIEVLDRPGQEAYGAKVTEKVGPFKLSLKLEVEITEASEPVLLKASLKGADPLGLNRVTGALQIALSARPPGTHVLFEASVEILGRLATLGAPVVRRRTTELFSQFAQRIHAQFVQVHP